MHFRRLIKSHWLPQLTSVGKRRGSLSSFALAMSPINARFAVDKQGDAFFNQEKTPLKTKMTFKNPPFQYEIHLHSWWICQQKHVSFRGDLTHPPPSRSLVLHLLSCWNRSWDHTPSCISLPIISIISSLSWLNCPQKKMWLVNLVDHPTDQFNFSKGPFFHLSLLGAGLPNTARQVMWWSTCCDLVVVQSSTETARGFKIKKKSMDFIKNARRTEQQHQHDPMSAVVLLFLLRCFANVALLSCLEVTTPPVLPCFSTPVESWTSPEMFEIAPWARFSTWSKRPTLDVFTAWWFELPIWKKCLSKWIISPSRGSGVKIKKLLKPPPRLILCIVTNLVESFCCKNSWKCRPVSLCSC